MAMDTLGLEKAAMDVEKRRRSKGKTGPYKGLYCIITNTNEYYDELKDATTHSHDTLSSNARYK